MCETQAHKKTPKWGGWRSKTIHHDNHYSPWVSANLNPDAQQTDYTHCKTAEEKHSDKCFGHGTKVATAIREHCCWKSQVWLNSCGSCPERRGGEEGRGRPRCVLEEGAQTSRHSHNLSRLIHKQGWLLLTSSCYFCNRKTRPTTRAARWRTEGRAELIKLAAIASLKSLYN